MLCTPFSVDVCGDVILADGVVCKDLVECGCNIFIAKANGNVLCAGRRGGRLLYVFTPSVDAGSFSGV